MQARPGAPYRYDHHYERNGTINLFTFFEPLSAWRTVMTRERRTKIDWAKCIRRLLDEHYREAEKVILVMDNNGSHLDHEVHLNTHKPSSLYEAFAPAEARRLAERLEIHYTPEHGSWLNMAEVEQSVMARQCLGRRVPGRPAMQRTTTAWYHDRLVSRPPGITIAWYHDRLV